MLPIKIYRLTDHARFEMARRQIEEADVARVLAAPEQIEELSWPRRVVYQARLALGDPRKTYLLRVFIDVDCLLPAVVTVYRTSKVDKYWRSNR